MGGGGGDDGSKAAGVQADYARQAQEQQAAYLQQALGIQKEQFNAGRKDLATYYNEAKSGLSPYALGGYNAYDTYLGTLGQGTPTGGSFSLAQGLNQGALAKQRLEGLAAAPDPNATLQQKKNLLKTRFSGDFLMWGQSGLPNQGMFNNAILNPGGQQALYSWIDNQATPGEIEAAFENTKSAVSRMQATGATLEGVRFGGPRNDLKLISAFLGPAQGLPSYEDQLKQKKSLEDERARLEKDPYYLKYLDYEKGNVDMTAADPSGSLSRFFNTPEYQLQFGNSGSAVDPNADPRTRFQESPGYQFQLDQGRTQLEKSMASRGLLESGAFAKELNNYGQGVANQEWGNYQGKLIGSFQNYQNRLADIAGMGAQTSGALANMSVGQGSNLASLGSNYANQATNIYGALGTGAANSLLAQGGAMAGGLMNAANSQAANKQSKSQLGSLIGGAAGMYFGGAPGAAIGSSIGGGLF